VNLSHLTLVHAHTFSLDRSRLSVHVHLEMESETTHCKPSQWMQFLMRTRKLRRDEMTVSVVELYSAEGVLEPTKFAGDAECCKCGFIFGQTPDACLFCQVSKQKT